MNSSGVGRCSSPKASFAPSPDDSSESRDGEWGEAFEGFEGLEGFDFAEEIKPELRVTDPRRTGSFWDDMKEAGGADYLGGIDMQGLLNEQMDPEKNPPGIFHVQAKTEHGRYVLNICEENDADDNIAKVYWLPWSSVHKGGGSEFITIDRLNRLDCQFFMTSNLSGCRFVATDEYLAHFSKAQKRDGEVTENIIGRDRSEERLNVKENFQPTKRLALSISDISESRPLENSWSRGYYSYQRDTPDSGIAFVIGIKNNDGTWAIKYLKTSNKGPVYGGGTWYTMEYGEK